MLTNIVLKNLALIEEAEIDLEKGLNIMTGETGSGKSIIIGSVNMALGEKASKGLIRTGASFGLVELTFTTANESILSMLDDLGISRDGSTITITRKITADSSISKINGETVTLANTKQITSRLIDIHGQHDHQSLLNPAKHLEIIDNFGGQAISLLKKQLDDEYDRYKELREKARDYSLNEEALAREISLLEHEVKEIADADLKPGEDGALQNEYKKLSQAEKICEDLSRAEGLFADEAVGIVSNIGNSIAQIKSALAFEQDNESLKAFLGTLLDLDSLARDLEHDLASYINANGFDPLRHREVHDRLNEINRLKSKYGNSIDEILAHAGDVAAQLDNYKNYSENKAAIDEELHSSRLMLNKIAQQLSAVRKDAADRLVPMIIGNLKELNFLNVDFEIRLYKAEKIGRNGFDKAEFMISTNPGEAVQPLARIASGGEISRVMLAIKCAIAENDDIPTLIFDEIDTGISGKTAHMVAQKLHFLSENHQIISITHLPQIAAMADTHYSIHKEVSDGMTISGIEKLDTDASIREIAKLISGAEITPATLQSAAELKNRSVI